MTNEEAVLRDELEKKSKKYYLDENEIYKIDLILESEGSDRYVERYSGNKKEIIDYYLKNKDRIGEEIVVDEEGNSHIRHTFFAINDSRGFNVTGDMLVEARASEQNYSEMEKAKSRLFSKIKKVAPKFKKRQKQQSKERELER
ncbi:hypothetical protein [uncultured Campylobacter sp.]|uniref:hypothetical protein n=1 Tax=uncultured Campylobacter sp. TaxID=218934 RepID=UPI00260F6D18|nr:hypothetical protein [uncultured Campylobacter sp.]